MLFRSLEITGAGAKTNVGYGQLASPERNPPPPPNAPNHDRTPAGAKQNTPVTTQKLQIKPADKWKQGDPIKGIVTEHQEKNVYFKSTQVIEQDWLLKAERVPLADRLIKGLEINLAVIKSDAKEKVIIVRVTEFPRQ